MEQLPTLVTYRSATELRNAGIHFGYRKAGLHCGLLVAVLCMVGAMHLTFFGVNRALMWALFCVGAAAIFVALYAAKTLEFPQCPRISLEELEVMRRDMGLLPEIFQQTHDAVLQGTPDEHRAIKMTDSVLSTLQKKAASSQTK